TTLGFFLVTSISGYHGNVAAISQSVGVGRIRGWDLFHCLNFILVFRLGSGSGHHSRSRAETLAEEILWLPGPRLAQLGRSLAAPSNRLLAPGWAGDAACPFRP